MDVVRDNQVSPLLSDPGDELTTQSKTPSIVSEYVNVCLFYNWMEVWS